MQENSKVLPRFVTLTRYIRPINEFGEIDNRYGATLIIELDYIMSVMRVGYSVCLGENFQKQEGVDRAMDRFHNDPLVLPMIDGTVSKHGVVADIVRAFESILHYNWVYADQQTLRSLATMVALHRAS